MRGALERGERDSLERLLSEHEPADEKERVDAEQVRDFVARHADPFDRRIAEGHLTGSAFVLDPDRRVLLTLHRKLGLWLQLGGHADGERDAPAVALREAREESGLPDLTFHPGLCCEGGQPRLLDLDVHAIPARREEPAHLHLDLRFVLLTESPEAIVADPRETERLEWVDFDETERRGDASMARAVARLGSLPA